MHSPPYKQGKYTKEMQIKHLIVYKSIEIELKCTKMTKSKRRHKRVKNLTLELNQK